MPRLRKPSAERLTDNINVPVNQRLKRQVERIAKAKGEPSHTRLARQYIERCAAEDEQKLSAASA
jgi:hypothetical protein